MLDFKSMCDFIVLQLYKKMVRSGQLWTVAPHTLLGQPSTKPVSVTGLVKLYSLNRRMRKSKIWLQRIAYNSVFHLYDQECRYLIWAWV